MSPERAAVTCQGVSKTYVAAAGSVEALHAVELVVEAGTIAALVGPSGSGKSTLLRLIASLDEPDAGRIAVLGVDVAALRGGALRRYRRTCAAYVAQRAAASLVPHLTVREQLGTGNAEAAGALGLGSRLDARAEQLSGGEQARAALAVALARDTPVLLLDEPTAELDRAAATLVTEALTSAAADGRTIVLTTHDEDLLALASATIDLAPRAEVPLGPPRRATVAAAPVLEVRQVSKAYRGRFVVEDASLRLSPGEVGVLLGRSGSGKSTLLMAIGRFLRPDAGAVTILGADAVGVPPWHTLSYLAQRFALLPELSVRENVALPLRLSAERDGARVTALLDQLALGDLAERRPAEISIGQQQRAALARALVRRPSVLVADEPTSHQDRVSAALVWDALSAAADGGTACLVATHEEAAAAHAGRVWRIVDGRVSSSQESTS
ncbi:MAG: ATP-binding cassette domain-containing protein [Gaiellaceae bacterium]